MTSRSAAAASAASDAYSWPAILTPLIAGDNIPAAATAWAMDEIMAGNASDAQVAGFLVALRAKGETIEELTALSTTMLAHAVPLSVAGSTVDIVGTGGDRANTVNISTMAALVIAGTGTRVVKHGNRAASSMCGSADLLEALGVRLDVPVDDIREQAETIGIAFCFALAFHPAMRHVAVARRDLGVATAFNFLGPLTNPARPTATAVGVADPRMAPLMAGVFAARGIDALVFRGEDGLDELAPTGPARVWEVRNAHVEASVIDPSGDLDVPRCSIADLKGRDAAFNASVARSVLAGAQGPVRDAVLLNASAALVARGDLVPAEGDLTERLAAGMSLAAQSIDSGAAANVLDRWVAAGR